MKTAIFQIERAPYRISTDPALLNVSLIHRFLSEQSYWAKNISFEVVERYLPHSLCFGVYKEAEQVGFARVITDYGSFAYVGDVFILPHHRGHGLGKWLVASMLKHPSLQNLRRWMLFTEDAHGLYQQYGFEALPQPDRAMAKINFTEYPAKSPT
ncbi:MAG: GNAT family N-acetyltransferase [Bacteroidota bacterium]